MKSLELLIPCSLNFLAPAIVDDLVRIGRKHDGGYVVPELAIDTADFLLSLGIGDNWSFDSKFKHRNPSIPIHAYDYSVSRDFYLKTAINAIKGIMIAKYPFVRRSALLFFAHRIQCYFSYNSFFREEVRHFQERVTDTHDLPSDVTLNKIFERADAHRVFLKVDIEGTEYKIIDDILKYESRIICIVIEFHNTHKRRADFTSAVIKLLNSFDIVHFHANNNAQVAPDNLPEVIELTFSRKPVRNIRGRRTILPLPDLDSPCRVQHSDYIIKFSQ